MTVPEGKVSFPSREPNVYRGGAEGNIEIRFVIDYVARSEILAGNGLIVRCHATSK